VLSLGSVLVFAATGVGQIQAQKILIYLPIADPSDLFTTSPTASRC
jgi:hypothetical protein